MSIFRRAICAVKEKKTPLKKQQQQPRSPLTLEEERAAGGVYSANEWSGEVPVIGDGELGYEACYRLLKVLDHYDAGVGKVPGSDVMPLRHADMHLVVLLYNHMLSIYDSQYWCDRDNEGKKGTGSSLLPGQPVPNYYANIQDQTIHRRKVLSLAGLRNLVIYGVEIYHELHKKMFSGDPTLYKQDQGVHKMRNYTGNTVDLDTTVLRANDNATLKVVNVMNERASLPQYATPKEFGNSEQAAEIARVASRELLLRFAKDHGLSKADVKKRKVDPAEITKNIPVARSNSDRGKYPLWRYVNVGQDSFHCNVPCLEDVVGALLRAPIRAAKIYLRMLLTHKGEALKERITHFFGECIVDACFNQKWRAIEEYEKAVNREDSIVTILQTLQKEHQGKLLKVMDCDDSNYTLEKSVMWNLARGRCGRDSQGVTRGITQKDVEKWVDDPAAEL
eukprot:TRINITY_DN2028_c2_g1_i1.p1 TRINITY_DN2028_c2_g1~~TRINITY_DN2028_c2_g1_i1.p1  ORF type:complete len:449 (+),score=70.13 TRINITY_DN2028_c2_g1_i1:218-1564(+)